MAQADHFLAPLMGGHAGGRIVVERTNGTVADTIERAFDSTARRRGLLGREALPDGTAIILAPTWAVHTFFMKFEIDLVFARRDGHVLKVRPNVRAWRVSAAVGAFAVVELGAGAAARAGLRAGDRLVISVRP